jgi:hypothetical protein
VNCAVVAPYLLAVTTMAWLPFTLANWLTARGRGLVVTVGVTDRRVVVVGCVGAGAVLVVVATTLFVPRLDTSNLGASVPHAASNATATAKTGRARHQPRPVTQIP